MSLSIICPLLFTLIATLPRPAVSVSSNSNNSAVVNSVNPYTLWGGANSFFLHTYPQADRQAILDAAEAANMKVIRIFINAVGQGAKGSSSVGVSDLESSSVGAYDDTVLSMIDDLMLDVSTRNIKLTIAMHDRYALGCWGTDAYVYKYNIPNSGCSPPNDASVFYLSAQAQADFDARLTHILNHVNPHFGQPWAKLDNVVFSFQPQNEPQGHDPVSSMSKTWLCGRAQHMKSLTSLPISSGGSGVGPDPLIQSTAACPFIDILSLHDYNNPQVFASSIQAALSLANGKRVIAEEWGVQSSDPTSKTNGAKSYINAIVSQSVPWMFWELVNPGRPDGGDFETWTSESCWSDAFAPLAQQTATMLGSQCWPEIWGGTCGVIPIYDNCVAGSSVCASSSVCCIGKGDVSTGKYTCRPESDCSNIVPVYDDCTLGVSVCQPSSFCCIGSGDVSTGKYTCRPPSDCTTPTSFP